MADDFSIDITVHGTLCKGVRFDGGQPIDFVEFLPRNYTNYARASGVLRRKLGDTTINVTAFDYVDKHYRVNYQDLKAIDISGKEN